MIGSVTSQFPLTPEGVNPSSSARVQQEVEPKNSFSDLLGNALQKVNQDQIEAENMSEQLAAGKVENVHEVMVAAEQASLGLQLTVQVKNKVVEAYQEIMRMQI